MSLWYTDADGHKSGRKVKNRPGWLALENRLDDLDVGALVSNDLSRLHRKSWRIGHLLDRLDENGVRLVFAAPGREAIDASTPTGRMLISFMAIQDEAYANDISERAKDSIVYRKGQGKTIGMPPFGTLRNEAGYLEPSPYGAWLLPDGRFVAGEVGQESPEAGALWRGFHDCARRILELYADNKLGIERIAYQIADEGWAFRDRKNQPRPVNRDDIRRVVSNWRQYAGLSPVGKAKEMNASMIADPVSVLHDTGRSVFSLDLIRAVAEVQAARSVTRRPFGSVKASHPYPLTRLLICARCEQKALDQNNPALRSRMSGVDQNGNLRYRHAEGVKCGCKTRSVSKESIEADFSRLISLLTLSEEALPLLTELAIQSEQGGPRAEDADLEAQKQAAIAKLRRKIDNNRYLFEDGDLSREDYLKRKEQYEQEIAHWEARTTEIQKAAVELAMCMEAVNTLSQIWGTSTDEDRQEMARMLFEYIVYDLDKQQIVDFRLKPWADRFLVLRASLYGDDDPLTPIGDGGGDSGGDSGGTAGDDHKPTSDFRPNGPYGALWGRSFP